MKTLVNISGGAIKFIALISSFVELLNKGVKPKALSGTSAGAIIVFLYVCGKIKEGWELARRSDDISLIFSKKNRPIGNISGFSLSAIFRILTGKNYAGIMDNLESNLRSIVSEELFYKYASDPKSPDCYILAIESSVGKHIIMNLKNCSYEEAIGIVIASSTIAPIIKARSLNGMKLNDGGHRGHSAGAHLLRKNYDDIKSNIDECITIFSRSEPSVYEDQLLGKTNSFFQRLQNFTIGCSIKETSLNDEYVEKRECEESEIVYTPIYLSEFTTDTYIITKDQIAKGERIGIESIKKWFTRK